VTLKGSAQNIAFFRGLSLEELKRHYVKRYTTLDRSLGETVERLLFFYVIGELSIIVTLGSPLPKEMHDALKASILIEDRMTHGASKPALRLVVTEKGEDDGSL
jgi:hypothetical protein